MLDVDLRYAVAVAAVVTALVSLKMLRLRTEEMSAKAKEARAKAKAIEDHGLAVRHIGKAVVGDFPEGSSSSSAYGALFDRPLRDRIHLHIGKPEGRLGVFQPYQLTSDQIMQPECQKTITDVLAAVERFCKDNPKDVLRLGLKE